MAVVQIGKKAEETRRETKSTIAKRVFGKMLFEGEQ
jgi:hypothetical protein